MWLSKCVCEWVRVVIQVTGVACRANEGGQRLDMPPLASMGLPPKLQQGETEPIRFEELATYQRPRAWRVMSVKLTRPLTTWRSRVWKIKSCEWISEPGYPCSRGCSPPSEGQTEAKHVALCIHGLAPFAGIRRRQGRYDSGHVTWRCVQCECNRKLCHSKTSLAKDYYHTAPCFTRRKAVPYDK